MESLWALLHEFKFMYLLLLLVVGLDEKFIVLAGSKPSGQVVKGQRAQATKEELASWKTAAGLENEAVQAMTRGDLNTGTQKYFEACKLRRAPNLQVDTAIGHPLILAVEHGFRRVGRVKLRHDAEQLDYLVMLGRLPASPYGRIAELFKRLIPRLPRDHVAVDIDLGIHPLFDRAYNRALHLTWPRRTASGSSALSRDFDAKGLERRFRASALAPEARGCEAQNGVAYADGLLAEPVLKQLYQWCLESTMWFSSRAGYVAAFMQEAFNAPLLAQVVEELRGALPSILGEHQLMNMWAFKYANNASDWPLEGVAVHADVAAVNVNLWISEDDANEDPEGGGLFVYTKQAPRDWGFEDYNSLAVVPRIREYLNDSKRISVPHRRNRVLIFNSNLFHESQTPRFRPGYTGRRINLTFLFGRRCGGAGANEGQAATQVHEKRLADNVAAKKIAEQRRQYEL